MIQKLIKRIKNPDKLISMSKKDRKDFLSNDFVDRMIKVEQRVSSSFGEFIPYKKTKYYLSLSNFERKKYEKYLNSGKKKWTIMLFSLMACIFAFAIFNLKLTGNAINSNFGEGFSSLGSNIVIIFVLAGLFLMGLIFLLKKRKEIKFNKRFEVIDRIVCKRRLEKNIGW